jgi:hypothetical protein
MFKKVVLILILSVALGAFLYLRPLLFGKVDPPRIEDRLPEADFLGRAYLLDVARETSGMLFYHKIPFRDFFSYEFLLGQGKMYGLNLQNPAYFFAYETGQWGAVLHVSDSSKIFQGIERLRKFADIRDTLINEQKVYTYPAENGYLFYGKNYLLVYKGKNFEPILKQVSEAKRFGIAPCWKAFLHEKQFRKEKLVIYSNWKKLKDNGIKTAIFAHDSDSVSFSLLAYIRNTKPLNIAMKAPGMNFKEGEFASKMLNIHLDITKLRTSPTDPIYIWLVKLGRKIGFPTAEFLSAWDGDLSFRQGGFQTVQESYIESVLDEDFNVTEVEKKRNVNVPGFSLILSMNEKGQPLFNRLMAKGIITQHDDKFRFLFSPELRFKKKDNYYIFHSGAYTPAIEEHRRNNGVWTERGTRLQFSLDSLSRTEAFGTIYIPVDRLIRRNKFF